MSSRRPQPPPEVLGAQWRPKMTEDCESVEALVWKRCIVLFKLDLADPRQANDLQVYELLAPLRTVSPVRARDLITHVDKRVPKLFKLT